METLQILKANRPQRRGNSERLLLNVNTKLLGHQEQVEAIPEGKSPEPPSPMSPASPNLQKECPICMNFMTEPCAFPDSPCEHRMCLDCMKLMFHKGSTDVFKFDESLNKVCAKCPVCRALSFVDLMDGTATDKLL